MHLWVCRVGGVDLFVRPEKFYAVGTRHRPFRGTQAPHASYKHTH